MSAESLAFEFPGILRDRIVTGRDLAIEAGQDIAQWQALALNDAGTALVAYDSEETGPPHSISMRAVVTGSESVHVDYLIYAVFNAPSLVFKNEVDSWQSVVHSFRIKGIYIMPFTGEPDDSTAALVESS